LLISEPRYEFESTEYETGVVTTTPWCSVETCLPCKSFLLWMFTDKFKTWFRPSNLEARCPIRSCLIILVSNVGKSL
jgi:hypothetical protein